MMTEQQKQTVAAPSKPSDPLIHEVINALVEGNLIRPQDAERLTTQLLTGTIKAEDWLVLAENAVLDTPFQESTEENT